MKTTFPNVFGQKLLGASLLALSAVALPLMVSAQSAAEMDANGDGMLSVEEVQAAYPEVTGDTFIAMDANGDGLLDADEVAAAQEGGMLPAG